MSKDTLKNYIDGSLIFSNTELPEEISITKIKTAIMTSTLMPKEARQVLANLKALEEAIKVFKQRNFTTIDILT